MTRSIDDIRRDWSDPTHCLRESDEADVRVLLEALDEAEERANATHGMLLAARRRADAAAEEHADESARREAAEARADACFQMKEHAERELGELRERLGDMGRAWHDAYQGYIGDSTKRSCAAQLLNALKEKP